MDGWTDGQMNAFLKARSVGLWDVHLLAVPFLVFHCVHDDGSHPVPLLSSL